MNAIYSVRPQPFCSLRQSPLTALATGANIAKHANPFIDYALKRIAKNGLYLLVFFSSLRLSQKLICSGPGLAMK
ncbi:MAG TPA: hypothetical protein VGZ25_13425 [Gemmataceae bacterium]|nr:hypothetical protein [Gemmataceae bacterium]